MKPKLFIRITSILIFIFAVGHSIGHFTRYNTADSQALNTISIMQKTKIPMDANAYIQAELQIFLATLSQNTSNNVTSTNTNSVQ
uniref:LIC_13387 family protein n=1 Tax=Leptospira weilii TaxID=28184 RepID=UPI000A93AA10